MSFVPQKYLDFVTRFYKTSDKNGAHEEYAKSVRSFQIFLSVFIVAKDMLKRSIYSCLTDDATCNFSGVSHTGRANIITMREGMWEHIVKRDHHPERVFVGQDGSEIVVWGSADFTKKTGEEFRTTFFARCTFADKDAEELKMTHYEVVKRQ